MRGENKSDGEIMSLNTTNKKRDLEHNRAVGFHPAVLLWCSERRRRSVPSHAASQVPDRRPAPLVQALDRQRGLSGQRVSPGDLALQALHTEAQGRFMHLVWWERKQAPDFTLNGVRTFSFWKTKGRVELYLAWGQEKKAFERCVFIFFAYLQWQWDSVKDHLNHWI